MTNPNDICAQCGHPSHEGCCTHEDLKNPYECECQQFKPQQPERGDEKCETNSPKLLEGQTVSSPAAEETKAAKDFVCHDCGERKPQCPHLICDECFEVSYVKPPELSQLQEKLRQLEADCAVKDTALKLFKTLYPKSEHINTICDKALSPNCGSELLAERDRYKKALEEAQAACERKSYNIAHQCIKKGLIQTQPTKE